MTCVSAKKVETPEMGKYKNGGSFYDRNYGARKFSSFTPLFLNKDSARAGEQIQGDEEKKQIPHAMLN